MTKATPSKAERPAQAQPHSCTKAHTPPPPRPPTRRASTRTCCVSGPWGRGCRGGGGGESSAVYVISLILEREAGDGWGGGWGETSTGERNIDWLPPSCAPIGGLSPPPGPVP